MIEYKIKCGRCGLDITVKSGKQKYCGSQKIKNSCSYLAMKDRTCDLSRQRKRKVFEGVIVNYREWWIKNVLNNTQRAEYERYLGQEDSYDNLPIKIIRI